MILKPKKKSYNFDKILRFWRNLDKNSNALRGIKWWNGAQNGAVKTKFADL